MVRNPSLHSVACFPPGLTVPLLTTSSGEKLGKSVGNAVWLSDSSYLLYQAMLQVADQEVAGLLCRLTFLPLEEVELTIDHHSVRLTRESPCNHALNGHSPLQRGSWHRRGWQRR